MAVSQCVTTHRLYIEKLHFTWNASKISAAEPFKVLQAQFSLAYYYLLQLRYVPLLSANPLLCKLSSFLVLWRETGCSNSELAS